MLNNNRDIRIKGVARKNRPMIDRDRRVLGGRYRPGPAGGKRGTNGNWGSRGLEKEKTFFGGKLFGMGQSGQVSRRGFDKKGMMSRGCKTRRGAGDLVKALSWKHPEEGEGINLGTGRGDSIARLSRGLIEG